VFICTKFSLSRRLNLTTTAFIPTEGFSCNQHAIFVSSISYRWDERYKETIYVQRNTHTWLEMTTMHVSLPAQVYPALQTLQCWKSSMLVSLLNYYDDQRFVIINTTLWFVLAMMLVRLSFDTLINQWLYKYQCQSLSWYKRIKFSKKKNFNPPRCIFIYMTKVVNRLQNFTKCIFSIVMQEGSPNPVLYAALYVCCTPVFYLSVFKNASYVRSMQFHPRSKKVHYR
jgi:hypothetical protein